MARKRRGKKLERVPYSTDEADFLLECFVDQNYGLSRFVDSSDMWPSSNTVWRWQAEHEEFRIAVAVARERQLERMMYDTLNDLMDCDPTEGFNPGDGAAIVAKHKAAADISQKLASKMVPKKFCERLAVDFDGKLDGRVHVTIDSDDVEEIDESAVADA